MNRYVLITPAKNEGKYISHTLRSVVSQTILPLVWFIVSDNSTDNTDEIVKEYERQYSFIKLIRNTSDNKRNFGSQVRAFLKGYNELVNVTYDFIGNLDADVSFDKDYYQRILCQFNIDKKLGLAGGFIFEEKKGAFCSRKYNSTSSVAHAIQLFRRECYEDIGGYIPLRYGGSDSVAEVMVRMHDWKVKAYPWLEVRHHKPTLSAEGQYNGAFRQGLMDYSMGNHFFYAFCRCLLRVNHSILYSLCRISGFMYAGLKRNPCEVDPQFRSFFRKEQKHKMFEIARFSVQKIFNIRP
ncbi:MAG: glycosyltransferase [Clostridiaceae bacterium]|nr:glycosyltransferase [Clostridiaceae bacterium]